MGLDMYLKAELWVSGWDHKPDPRFPAAKSMFPFEVADHSPSVTVGGTVAYWRKANQIHGWFVREVQGGEDDCRPYNVNLDQLRELVALCKEVDEDHSKAEELLPVQSGFFFGGEEYDEWYFNDVQDTIKQLEPFIEKAQELQDAGEWADIQYQSSW